MLVWLGILPWCGWKASPPLHSTMTLHCKSSLSYLSVLDMASVTCSILVQRNGLSLCSGVSFIIGVLAGGMGRIYVRNSPAPPGAFGSAAGGWGEVVEHSMEKAWEFSKPPGCWLFSWQAESSAVRRAVLSCRPSGWRQVSEGS